MSNNVAEKVSSQICTGCGACKNSCPFGAIQMQLGDGFFYKPSVNEKCVDCGLCVKVCPVLEPVYLNIEEPDCYAFMADDEIRMRSSSGGAFEVLSTSILNQGGYVCGVEFSPDFKTANHTIIDKYQDLQKLQISKYFQSDAKDIYKQIKILLENNEKVLFSGCPCQVAGLNSFLGKDFEGLTTVEIICHGIPSVVAYQAFIKEISERNNNKEINSFVFRDNTVEKPWHNSIFKVEFEDGTCYSDKNLNRLYYDVYFRGDNIAEACFSCKFIRFPRQADMTIGDFWGIEQLGGKYNDEKGTSVIILNTQKSKKYINDFSVSGKLFEKLPLEWAIFGNMALHSPNHRGKSRELFFQNLKSFSFSESSKIVVEPAKNIAVVGLWYGINYGSILTYFALYKMCEEKSDKVFLIEKPEELWAGQERFYDKNSIARVFLKPRCNISARRKSYEKWKELNSKFDTFIVGSDVVWNRQICGGQNFFFLDFVNLENRKIAFACSFGAGYKETPEKTEVIRTLLNNFNHIYIRENSAKEILKNNFDVYSETVLDPVFLIDRKIYDDIADNHRNIRNDKFFTAYFLGFMDYHMSKYIQQIANLSGLSANIFVNPNLWERHAYASQAQGIPATEDISVENWLYSIKYCDLYIGASFHGLCFALIFEKNFICIIRKNLPDNVRYFQLLEQLDLTERIVYMGEDNTEKIKKLLEKKVDYSKINSKLKELIRYSKDKFFQALKK